MSDYRDSLISRRTSQSGVNRRHLLRALGATSALAVVDAALETISGIRADLGAAPSTGWSDA